MIQVIKNWPGDVIDWRWTYDSIKTIIKPLTNDTNNNNDNNNFALALLFCPALS